MSSIETTPRNPVGTRLRVWPVLGLLIVMWVLRWIPSLITDVSMPLFMAAIMGPVVCSLLILVWWVAGSRATRREKILGFFGVVAIVAVTTLLAHPTARGFVTVISAVPWGMSAFSLGLLVAHWAGLGRRTGIALLAAFLGFGYWSLVRVDGVWGDFDFDRQFRWQPTPEERLVAERSEQVGAVVHANQGQVTTAEWPGFRGPDRDATVPGIRLEEDWVQHPPRELWRIRVGPGWSSFAVAGGRLFTQEQRGDNEAVVSYDTASGAELWAFEYPSRFWEAMGGLGPRATPTLADGGLFALGAEGLLHRLDPGSGQLVWRADLREDAGRQPPEWGFASSPLVVDGVVIVYAGGQADRGVLAYDAESGELRWGVAAGGHSYSSARLSTILGQRSVPMVTDAGLTLIDPADGSVLFEHDWPFENYRILLPVPIDEETLLMSTGFGVGTRRLDLRLVDGAMVAEERWTSRSLKPDFNDLVAHEGHLYGLDPGILACVDLETGERLWKGGRYGHGQLLLLPDSDQLLITTEKGELVLVRADPEQHQELARHEVFSGKSWNHPALVGDRLYMRNAKEAVALELPVR